MPFYSSASSARQIEKTSAITNFMQTVKEKEMLRPYITTICFTPLAMLLRWGLKGKYIKYTEIVQHFLLSHYESAWCANTHFTFSRNSLSTCFCLIYCFIHSILRYHYYWFLDYLTSLHSALYTLWHNSPRLFHLCVALHQYTYCLMESLPLSLPRYNHFPGVGSWVSRSVGL